MKNFKITLTLAVCFFPLWLGAKQVSPETARQVAEAELYSRDQLRNNQLPELNPVYVETIGSKTLSAPTHASSHAPADVVYYVFNTGEKGFIIVSGDDIAVPVLGYSDSGTYDPKRLPPNFVYWMDCLANEIKEAIAKGYPQSEKIKELWEAYRTGKISSLRASTSVNPILKTQWDQTSPYSDLCPNQVYTGCVATAMAQIMKRHNHPAKRTVTIPAYKTQTNGWAVPALPATAYAWASMTNTYDANSTSTEKTAVATLMYHCGASVGMDYTEEESGAYSRDAGIALIKYFDYDRGLLYKQRVYYSDIDWEAMLKEEIDKGRPVFYAGSNPSGGHAFVCDGYDDSGKFHFNWGWSGYRDGYFVTTALNPGGGSSGAGAGTYNQNQEILINIKPNSGGAITHDIKIKAQTNISASNTTLDRGEAFTVNAPVSNLGLFNFTGSAGIAIVDAGDNILSVIGQRSINLDPGYSYVDPYAINCTIPVTAATGQCSIRVVYKLADASQWTLAAGTPGYADMLSLTITNNPPRTHGIKIMSNSALTSSAAAVNRGAAFTVSAIYGNEGTTTVTGDYGMALVDNSDRVLEIIGVSQTNLSLEPNYHWNDPFVATCGISSAINPGTYKIRAVFRPTGEDWSIIYGETSKVIDILNITVNSTIIPDNSNLRIYPSFTFSPNPVSQDNALSVDFGLVNNTGTGPFMGEIELALCDLNGALVEVIAKQYIYAPNDRYYREYTFSSPQITSPKGTYLLTLFQKSIVGDRKKVGDYSTSIQNAVEVTVIGIPPKVTEVTPANGATDVPVNGQLIITFDKPMNTAAGVGIVLLGGGVVNNEYKTWSSNGRVCTIPYSGLPYNTTCTFHISGFKSASGNLMDAITSGYSFQTWVFTSISPPRDPQNDSAGTILVYSQKAGSIQTVSSEWIQQVSVFNIQGRKIYSEAAVNAREHTVSSLAPDVYIVKVVTKDEVKTVKINVR